MRQKGSLKIIYIGIKNGEVDLKIKVELMNDLDDEKLFVRMGFVNDLRVEVNNKANNFDVLVYINWMILTLNPMIISWKIIFEQFLVKVFALTIQC